MRAALPKVSGATFDSFLASLNEGQLDENMAKWLTRITVENKHIASMLAAVNRHYGGRSVVIGVAVYALLARQLEAETM